MFKDNTSDFIHLNFTGVKLNPDDITNCLDIEPISSSIAQKDIKVSSEVTKYKKIGNWVFGFDYSIGITEQLYEFTNFFRDKESALKEIVSWESVEGAYIDIVVNPDRDFGIHCVLLKGNDFAFWGTIGLILFLMSGILRCLRKSNGSAHRSLCVPKGNSA